jgi:Ni/Fe-hydrogenase 1 B-type cytochrome subunit
MATIQPDTKDERLPSAGVVYVWELPVRVIHWTIVLLLIVLSFTGYYLHHPFLGAGAGSGPGHPGFLLGTIRSVHEIAGFTFTAAVLARAYWALVGNRYARWRGLLPLTAAQRRDLLETVRFYALRRRRPPPTYGHNPLAALAYLALYGCFLLSILSGFGLFAWVIRIGPWTTLFGWTYGVMAIEQLRLLHFLLMFVFGAFTIHHVYSSILFDIEERNGELSSIVTGYKSALIDDETSPSRS